MRAGALFGMMFGLGLGAVAIGVTVSRLVIGPAVEKGGQPPAVPVVAAAPPVISSAAAPVAAITARRRDAALARTHRRPTVVEPTPPASRPASDDIAQIAAPPPVVGGDAPIAIVRGGPAVGLPASRAPGARIIQVDPAADRR